MLYVVWNNILSFAKAQLLEFKEVKDDKGDNDDRKYNYVVELSSFNLRKLSHY